MLPPNQTRRSVREPWFALLVLAACATTPVTSAALHRPWIVRSAIAGADGEAIEVLGAPGPRSLLLAARTSSFGDSSTTWTRARMRR